MLSTSINPHRHGAAVNGLDDTVSDQADPIGELNRLTGAKATDHGGVATLATADLDDSLLGQIRSRDEEDR
jgi:hypothetical protein